MALTDITIDFDLAQILGADFDPRRTKAYVTTNVESGTLMDTTTGETRLGDEAVTIASDGTGSFTTWATGADGNPISWQTSLVVDYPRAGQRDRKRRVFGPWTLTTADAGKNITELEDEQAVPAEYQTAFTASMEAIRTDAEAARDAAVDISGISTSDAVVEALVKNTGGAGPLTSAALSATVATANAGGALAVAVDPVVLSASTYPIGVVGDVVYGTDGTNLRRSTNAGDTWTTIVNTLTGHSIAKLGNGEMIIISESNVKVSSGWTDANPAAATWTITATPTTNGGVNPAAAFIKSDWDVWDNYVLLGEYVTPDRTNSRKLRLSTDYGQTFTEIFDLNNYYSGVWLPADIHFHAVCIDPFATSLANPRLWFTHGDFGRGMYYSDNLGATWTAFHGAAGSDWDTFNSNPMTVTATRRGLVIGTDANVPDGIYIAKRTADDNPANWVIKRGATIPFDYLGGSLLGFTERSWRDDRTGLVWIVMRANHPGTVTTPLPARVFVSDGERAAIAYETPEARTGTGAAITVQGAWVAAGKLLFSYSNAGTGVPDRVVRLTPGGRGGRSYQDMNRGNALLGYAVQRNGVAVGYGATVAGQSVAVGSGATDTNDYNSTIGYGATTAGFGLANGYTASALSYGTACGYTATAKTEAVAAGAQATAWLNSTAIGKGATAGTSSTTTAAVAIGRNTTASANGALCIGQAGTASGVNSTLLGSGTVIGSTAVGLGSAVTASGTRAIAIGDAAQGTTTGSVGIGYQATSTHQRSYALGYQVSTTANDQLALGGKHIELVEMAAPGAPAADGFRMFVKDNGSGKTQLAIRFNTGGEQIIGSENGHRPIPSFTTALRPTGMVSLGTVFDTTLNKPIWWNGTNWVDATGATV